MIHERHVIEKLVVYVGLTGLKCPLFWSGTSNSLHGFYNFILSCWGLTLEKLVVDTTKGKFCFEVRSLGLFDKAPFWSVVMSKRDHFSWSPTMWQGSWVPTLSKGIRKSTVKGPTISLVVLSSTSVTQSVIWTSNIPVPNTWHRKVVLTFSPLSFIYLYVISLPTFLMLTKPTDETRYRFSCFFGPSKSHLLVFKWKVRW